MFAAIGCKFSWKGIDSCVNQNECLGWRHRLHLQPDDNAGPENKSDGQIRGDEFGTQSLRFLSAQPGAFVVDTSIHILEFD
jgi:hypothetical protein